MAVPGWAKALTYFGAGAVKGVETGMDLREKYEQYRERSREREEQDIIRKADSELSSHWGVDSFNNPDKFHDMPGNVIGANVGVVTQGGAGPAQSGGQTNAPPGTQISTGVENQGQIQGNAQALTPPTPTPSSPPTTGQGPGVPTGALGTPMAGTNAQEQAQVQAQNQAQAQPQALSGQAQPQQQPQAQGQPTPQALTPPGQAAPLPGQTLPVNQADQAALTGKAPTPNTRQVYGYIDGMMHVYQRLGRSDLIPGFLDRVYKTQQIGMTNSLRNAAMLYDQNPQAAGRELERGFSFITNGQELRTGVQNGQLYAMAVDEQTGQVKAQGPISKEWILDKMKLGMDPEKFFTLQTNENNVMSQIWKRQADVQISGAKAGAYIQRQREASQLQAARNAETARYHNAEIGFKSAKNARDQQKFQADMALAEGRLTEIDARLGKIGAETGKAQTVGTGKLAELAGKATGIDVFPEDTMSPEHREGLRQLTMALMRSNPNLDAQTASQALSGLVIGPAEQRGNNVVFDEQGNVFLRSGTSMIPVPQDLVPYMQSLMTGQPPQLGAGYSGGGLPGGSEEEETETEEE